MEACAFVGDNVNDLEVMKRAGFAVAVHIKHPDVAKVADVVITDPDLRAILPLFIPDSVSLREKAGLGFDG